MFIYNYFMSVSQNKNVIRRFGTESNPMYTFGPIDLEIPKGSFTFGPIDLEIPKGSFTLILSLIARYI